MNVEKQKQVSDLKCALECCEVAIEQLACTEISIKENEDVIRAYSWLQSVKCNIETEIDKIKCSKNPEPEAAPV